MVKKRKQRSDEDIILEPRVGQPFTISVMGQWEPPDEAPYANAAFEALANALIEITSSNNGQCRGREVLYKYVQNLCILDHDSDVYDRMRAYYQQHCKEMLQTLHECTVSDPLEQVNSVWSKHCNQMQTIIAIYLYLDRTCKKPGSLAILGRDLFRNELLSGNAWPRTVSSVLARVKCERQGTASIPDHADLLKQITTMTRDLNLYSVIETEFITETSQFYEEEGMSMCSSLDLDVVAYLHHVQARLDHEVARIHAYMLPQTLSPTIHAAEKALFANHLQTLISSGFNELMSSLPLSLNALCLFLQLACRVKGQSSIRRAFHEYIIEGGTRIMQPQDPSTSNVIGHNDIIDQISLFKDNIDSVVHDAGDMASDLQHACKDAFESVFRSRGNVPAELLSKHIDWLLQGHAELQDNDLEIQLNRCMVLFKFIHGKDMFEAFYKTDLAQRLLLSTSCSWQAEVNMISKLRLECGALFTTKLEGMFKDMELSTDLFKEFRQQRDMDLATVDFNVSVLTTPHWPPSMNQTPAVPLRIPSEIENRAEEFNKFYCKRHNGRKLSWVYNEAHCVLRGQFSHVRKDLVVTVYQALVLLSFNDGTEVQSYKTIKDKTSIWDEMLKHTLSSLCKQKLRVLKKRKKGPVVESDEFQVNKQFDSPAFRVILLSKPAECKVESQDVAAQVVSDRMYQIDAILVRRMKELKVCSQTHLIAYCLEQADFPIPIEQIHKRISSLLDREYLERDPANTGTFRYVA
uniref:Cullin family profile domain-containing protein n=1 Tax=Spongospora subterranea TaxID=70186 RepID=A0A0H5R5G6_9EUKA|eukprot:CRZ09378.1 hypothetical protein [Spongospora subterranea]